MRASRKTRLEYGRRRKIAPTLLAAGVITSPLVDRPWRYHSRRSPKPKWTKRRMRVHFKRAVEVRFDYWESSVKKAEAV